MNTQNSAQPDATSLPPNGEETGFTPTAKQLEFLELLRSQRDPSSVRHLCAQGVVARGTLYRWQLKPGFRGWLGHYFSVHMRSHYGILFITAMNSALNGNDRMAEIMLKLGANPKGMAALQAYIDPTGADFHTDYTALYTHPGEADPDAAPDDAAAGGPAPAVSLPPDGLPSFTPGQLASLPAPTAIISTNYRALMSIQGAIGESDVRQAKRLRDFSKYMLEVQPGLNLEQDMMRKAAPPRMFDCYASPLVPGNPEIRSLSHLRFDDFARRIGRHDLQITNMEHKLLLAECRADLIAAKAGHVCRPADYRPHSIPEPTLDQWRKALRGFDEDTRPDACEYPDPEGGPTCLEFLDAFRQGDLETARRGLAAGLPIHLRSTNNLTPFSLAARANQIEMFEFAVRAAELPPGQGPVPDFHHEPVFRQA